MIWYSPTLSYQIPSHPGRPGGIAASLSPVSGPPDIVTCHDHCHSHGDRIPYYEGMRGSSRNFRFPTDPRSLRILDIVIVTHNRSTSPCDPTVS